MRAKDAASVGLVGGAAALQVLSSPGAASVARLGLSALMISAIVLPFAARRWKWSRPLSSVLLLFALTAAPPATFLPLTYAWSAMGILALALGASFEQRGPRWTAMAAVAAAVVAVLVLPRALVPTLVDASFPLFALSVSGLAVTTSVVRFVYFNAPPGGAT